MAVTVQRLEDGLGPALVDFLVGLDGDDQTFLGVPVDGREVAERAARRWATQEGGRTIVAADAGAVVGLVWVEVGSAWSAHVGRLRVVLAPAVRGRGLGRRLALAGLEAALELGLAKVVVEVRSDQDAVIGLFAGLGFVPEALLTDQIRTPDGEYHDLITLAHRADQILALVAVLGAQDGVT